MNRLLQLPHLCGIQQYLSVGARLLSLSMFLSFIHAVAGVRISFLSQSLIPLVCISHVFLPCLRGWTTTWGLGVTPLWTVSSSVLGAGAGVGHGVRSEFSAWFGGPIRLSSTLVPFYTSQQCPRVPTSAWSGQHLCSVLFVITIDVLMALEGFACLFSGQFCLELAHLKYFYSEKRLFLYKIWGVGSNSSVQKYATTLHFQPPAHRPSVIPGVPKACLFSGFCNMKCLTL